MNAWRLGLRLLLRDWRSGELYLLFAALVLSVTAVTAVGFFTERVEGAMLRQGGELIGADLALDATSPIGSEFSDRARTQGLAVARTLELASVVLHKGGGTSLVQVKAVDPAYPLRGDLRVREGLEAPEQVAGGAPPPGEAWVDARLLHQSGLKLGDRLALGDAEFRITRLIAYEPDRGGNLLQLAPRVMIAATEVPSTGLVVPASRVRYRLLVGGASAEVDAFSDWARPRLAPNQRLIDARSARPEFESALDRASRFLHLAALVTLLVAGAAIALSSRQLVDRQARAVALMRCLGARRHLLARVLALRLVLLGVAAGLLGGLAGLAAQQVIVLAVADWIGSELPLPGPAPLFAGTAVALVALAGFALPPLVQLTNVPPLAVLRGDALRTRTSVVLTALAAAGALAGLVYWQAGDPGLAWRLMLWIALALAALIASALALVALAGVLAARARGVWRLGLAGLARRRGAAVLTVTGFGLGILALLLLSVVRVDLLEAWRDSLPEGAPNRFLINIQPSEVGALNAFFDEHDIRGSGLFPMIRGRLMTIGERKVVPEDYADPRAQRLAAREFNLSFAERPQEDNRIVAGRWWEAGSAPQLSVETGIAKTLGIELGDRLTFYVSGRAITASVTSLRQVQWDSFNVNFFVVAAPSLLGEEPATYVTSIYLPVEREALAADLLRQFPSVTLIDVDALLRQVRRVMDQGVAAVEAVFVLTLAAGLLVMVAGIQASLQARRAEHAILRTLGAGRRPLLFGLAVEFTATGLLAGLLASVFAELTGRVLANEVFGLALAFDPWGWLLGVLVSAAFVGVVGTLSTFPLLVRPPLSELRGAAG